MRVELVGARVLEWELWIWMLLDSVRMENEKVGGKEVAGGVIIGDKVGYA